MYNLLANETTTSLQLFLEGVLPTIREDWWPRCVVGTLTFQQQRLVEEKKIASLAGRDRHPAVLGGGFRRVDKVIHIMSPEFAQEKKNMGRAGDVPEIFTFAGT